MQQTTTYKLNLIETDDVFSPEPLNQNARKVETALADGAAALAEETAARQKAVADETAARKNADAAEATARQKAVADEIAARQKAVADEAAARKDAVAAETAARQKAVADEAAARKDAVAAETAAREKAVAAEAAARKSAVTALERHKFACGTYTGNTQTYGGSQTIKLPFTPKAVVIPTARAFTPVTVICLEDNPLDIIKIVSGGFTVYNMTNANSSTSSGSANTLNAKYTYLAFA